MTKFVVAGIWLITSAISGCSSTPSATDANDDRSCFNIREITSWNAIDDKHLFIEGVGSDNKYLFTMFANCQGIRFSQAIALSNQMSRVCSNDFGKVTYRDGSRRASCNIDNIEKVANKPDAEGIVAARSEKN